MRWLPICSLFLLVSINTNSTPSKHHFFEKADDFFQEYVNKYGAVSYKRLHQNPQPLTDLTTAIEDPQFQTLKGQDLKAFYLNAYNLLTLKQVVNHYPISSPKDVDGFFEGIEHQVAGKTLTLNQLEKNTLLKQFPDPRLHFALVCAAKGCPPLWPHAYKPDQLDQQLKKQTKRALMDEDFIRIKQEQRLVRISKIFKWYKDEFLREASSLLAYINEHRAKQLPADTRVRYYTYDWGLNAASDRP